MNNKPFILNDQFWIYPQLGLVKQIDPAKETRLEPRLMHLLCILVAHTGELVSRELLTKEVWDDYGSADEGLTQGISYLRKILNDDAKELIETVPKKGYVLHAVITTEALISQVEQPRNYNKKKAYWITAAILIVVIVAAYFIFYHSPRSAYPAKDVINNDKVRDTAGGKNADKLENKQKPANPDALPDSGKKKPKNADLKR